jgi:hypothetical protein
MFKTFEAELIKYNKPYILLKGNLDTRLKIATKQIDKLLKAKFI